MVLYDTSKKACFEHACRSRLPKTNSLSRQQLIGDNQEQALPNDKPFESARKNQTLR